MTTEEKLIKVAQNTTDAIEENKKIGSVLNQNQSNSIKQNKEKLIELNSELEQTLYGTDTGGKSYYDEVWDSLAEGNKIIPKTINGNPVIATDVSEIPHNLNVKLTSDTITDFSDIEVVQQGKNLFNRNDESMIFNGYFGSDGIMAASGYKTIVIPCMPNTTYTISKMISKRFAVATTTEYPVHRSSVSSYKSNYNTKFLTITTDASAKYLVAFVYMEIQDTDITFEEIADTIQIEYGTTATEYEPYKEPIVATANSNGIVEGLKSISPKMLLYSNADVDIELIYNKSWGMDYEWNKFWDIYQQKGEPVSLNYYFYGSRWNDETFKPKYDIRCSASGNTISSVFQNCGITDLAKILTEQGVKIDISRYTGSNTVAFFTTCPSLTRVPLIEVPYTANYGKHFYNCPKLHTIEGMQFAPEGTQTIQADCFYNDISLENITIIGYIGKSINFQHSPLSKASITNIIEHLCGTDTDVTGQTLTLKESAVNAAFTAEEWAALEATKTNWTINLV